MADIPIKIHSIMQICLLLDRAGKADDFVKHMQAAGAFVKIDRHLIQKVQDYFAENQLDNTPFGFTIMRRCPGRDYDCPHIEVIGLDQ